MATVTVSASSARRNHVTRPVVRKREVRAADTLIIGAGPAGLAAAASLKKLGVSFQLVDRTGLPAGAYARLHGGITLSSPTAFTALPGMPHATSKPYLTIDEYRSYLTNYANHHGLRPEAQTVERITRDDDQRFTVQFANESSPRRYRSIVVATGMCDHPQIPQIAGLNNSASKSLHDSATGRHDRPRVIHARDWPGPEQLEGQRILIVGGASSAIAIAEQCAEAGVAVVVSSRRPQMRFSFTCIAGIDIRRWIYPLTRRLPRWLLGNRCSLHPAFVGTERGFRGHERNGLIRVRGQVSEFVGKVAIFSDDSAEGSEPFDLVVLATGYRFEMPFLPKEVARAPAGHPLADRGESRSWPGMFFVGIPCSHSVGSEFLHGIAADAPLVAEQVRQRTAKFAQQPSRA